MWIALECGHYEQRMIRLNKDKTVTVPKRIGCSDCTNPTGAYDDDPKDDTLWEMNRGIYRAGWRARSGGC